MRFTYYSLLKQLAKVVEYRYKNSDRLVFIQHQLHRSQIASAEVKRFMSVFGKKRGADNFFLMVNIPAVSVFTFYRIAEDEPRQAEGHFPQSEEQPIWDQLNSLLHICCIKTIVITYLHNLGVQSPFRQEPKNEAPFFRSLFGFDFSHCSGKRVGREV